MEEHTGDVTPTQTTPEQPEQPEQVQQEEQVTPLVGK